MGCAPAASILPPQDGSGISDALNETIEADADQAETPAADRDIESSGDAASGDAPANDSDRELPGSESQRDGSASELIAADPCAGFEQRLVSPGFCLRVLGQHETRIDLDACEPKAMRGCEIIRNMGQCSGSFPAPNCVNGSLSFYLRAPIDGSIAVQVGRLLDDGQTCSWSCN